ncbi:MAG: response regulator, partial [Anaerolineae bacterium]|nr:response regulator [Anaerolineae bacterium]
ASKIRNHPATESIPILMFTAKTAVNDKIAGFQAGADDYLTKPIRPQDLISRVENLLERQPIGNADFAGGHIVGFLPTKGGLGTSTLALNTAIELRNMHPDLSCALVELQAGRGTLAMQLGIDHRASLSDLLERPLSHITAESLNTYMVTHASGLRVLLASQEPVGIGPELTKRYVHTMLQYMDISYDYVLLDLPPDVSEPYREALTLCGMILLTVEPSRIGLALAEHMLSALDRFGIASQKVRVILLHRVPAVGTLSRNMIEQTLHREMVAGIPPVPDLALESGQNGRPMVDMQPHSLVAQQIRRVVQSIVEEQV